MNTSDLIKMQLNHNHGYILLSKQNYEQMIMHTVSHLFYEKITLFKGLCSEKKLHIMGEITLFDIMHLKKLWSSNFFPFLLNILNSVYKLTLEDKQLLTIAMDSIS